MYCIRGHDLWRRPIAARKMFADRSYQFGERLKWKVQIDVDGFETDQYDLLDPYYLIVGNSRNPHLGSMRFLPTTGPTMVNDYFLESLGGKPLSEESIWECSRFCVAPEAKRSTTLELLSVAAFALSELGIKYLVATFDDRTKKLYEKLGISPEMLGSMSSEEGLIHTGKWKLEGPKFESLCFGVKPTILPSETMRSGNWLSHSFENITSGLAWEMNATQASIHSESTQRHREEQDQEIRKAS